MTPTLRHRLAVAMAVIATVATIATSPPYSELSERHEGAAFDLGPDRSEVRIPFRTAVSDSVARKGAWGTRFDVRAVWRAVPPERRVLEVALVGPDGALLKPSTGVVHSTTAADRVLMFCREECLVDAELVVSWPAADAGSATVDWSVELSAEFDTDSPPEDALLVIEAADPPDDMRSAVVGSGLLEMSFATRPITARQTVQLTMADPAAELWLEVAAIVENDATPTAFVAVTDRERTRLAEGESLRLEPPAGCAMPCSWSIGLHLIDESAVPERREYVDWRLRRVGEGSPITAEVVNATPPSVTTGLDGDRVTLEGDEPVAVPLRLELDVATLGDDFTDTPPQVLLQAHATVDLEESSFPDDGWFSQSLVVPPSPHEYRHPAAQGAFGTGIRGHRPLGELTTAAPALLTCDGNRCSLDFELEHDVRDFGRHQVVFEWSVTAELFYPFADEPPPGAELTLTRR